MNLRQTKSLITLVCLLLLSGMFYRSKQFFFYLTLFLLVIFFLMLNQNTKMQNTMLYFIAELVKHAKKGTKLCIKAIMQSKHEKYILASKF